MATTLSDIIKETQALVATKTASFNKSAAIAGGDGSDYPGAECDKPVPAGAATPDAEVKQDLPPNGTSAAGAEDAEKVESGHAKDSTETADASVTSKAMDSPDANAKKASAETDEIANSLLGRIRAHQEKVASCGEDHDKKPVKKAEKAPDKKDEEAEDAAPADESKKAESGSEDLELTSDVLAKIASVILNSEEGIEFAEAQLTKAAGAEAAAETMEYLYKQAAYEAGAADAESMILALHEQKQAAAAQQDVITAEDIVKAGQAMADEILAAEGGGPEMGADMGADLGTGEEGMDVADDIADGGDMGDVSAEELQQALAMLVSEGSIDEQTAMALAEALGLGGGEEAAVDPEAEAAAAEAAAGAPAPEEDMEVAASDKQAEALEAKIAAAVKKVRGDSK